MSSNKRSRESFEHDQNQDFYGSDEQSYPEENLEEESYFDGQDEAAEDSSRKPFRIDPSERIPFEKYYRSQNILPASEWGDFMAHLCRPLPITFRMNSMESRKEKVAEALKFGEPFLKEDGAVHLPWCNGYKLPFAQFVLKNYHKRLHEWIKRHSAAGNLSRQELVSMIPPALLKVESHHAVLDLCAAPGSKTLQLLESLHSLEGEVTGFVMANDMNPQRSYILSGRCKHLGDACKDLIITNHRAQWYPNLNVPREGFEPSDQAKYPEGFYDRIVCDVPCSGEGAIRKSPGTWLTFHPENGVKLHSLQLQIAMRAATLLKVGGLMAYSTCSFNPVENEAVVAELLQRWGGALELVDTSDMHKGVSRKPGIDDWVVIDDLYNSYRTYDDYSRRNPETKRGLFHPTLWSPKSKGKKNPPLQYCLRFYPHLQDTGGFFVALLRKTGPLPGPSKPLELTPKKKKKVEAENSQTWHSYIPISHDLFADLQWTYKLPDWMEGHLCGRSENFRTVTLLGEGVKKSFESAGFSRLKVVNAGITLFRVDKERLQYKLTDEGRDLMTSLYKSNGLEKKAIKKLLAQSC
eukprot:TRINITY_DN9215_c0_g1_i1.p1 TRINITY_DN9215_c0_g1~~TRINITY_DN9215_c0_g1_i1.p1  ORF type:complete len:578 (-),score=112.45 TRINITY_DN9215_c0_g1_i1:43-1776(-)